MLRQHPLGRDSQPGSVSDLKSRFFFHLYNPIMLSIKESKAQFLNTINVNSNMTLGKDQLLRDRLLEVRTTRIDQNPFQCTSHVCCKGLNL